MDTTAHRNGARRALVSHFPALLTLCLAVLVAQLDTAVVNLGTHGIGAYFHAGVGALQWVVDAYNLTYAALLLTGGLLADLLGRRRIFILGAAIFTAASLVAAFSPTIGALRRGFRVDFHCSGCHRALVIAGAFGSGCVATPAGKLPWPRPTPGSGG